jgi:hypothetical protein
MNIINWADIVAECGDYKAAFVATFRKYEGMPTNERDGRGVVKVTQKTFAEHMGVPVKTFQRWVKLHDGLAESAKLRAAEGKAGTLRSAKNMAKKDPSALVDAIEMAGPTAADQIFHDLKLRRMGRPPLARPTKAEIKGQRARSAEIADKFVAPIKRALVEVIPHQLDEISEEVQEAIAQRAVTEATLTAIEEAAQRLLNTVQAGKVFVA